MAEALVPEFRLDEGGPLHRLERRARLERLRARVRVAIVVGWLPLVVLIALERLLGGRIDPIVFDFSIHCRALLAVPLFLIAEAALSFQAGRALGRVASEGLIADEDRPRLDALVSRVKRLRDSTVPELIILALALFVGVATLTGWLSPSGVVPTVGHGKVTPARVWYGMVTLPLFIFIMWRSLWRWGLWIRVQAGLASMVRLEPGHPDRRGGIDFLKFPSLSFFAFFLFAVSSTFCAGWGSQILFAGAHYRQFTTAFVAFAVLGELLTFGPMLLFTPRLFLNGHAGRREYGSLATDCTRAFRGRWLASEPRGDPLTSPDLQSLNDLGGVFRDSVESSVAFLFAPRDLLTLLGVMLIPTVPLLLTAMPLDEILRKLGGLLLGGH